MPGTTEILDVAGIIITYYLTTQGVKWLWRRRAVIPMGYYHKIYHLAVRWNIPYRRKIADNIYCFFKKEKKEGKHEEWWRK